jgi:hypothetical protein
MTKLVRRQVIQQLIGVELDDVSLLRRERLPMCQPAVNDFAGADEIQNLFAKANRTHGDRSLPAGRHGVREGRMSGVRARGASYKTRACPSVLYVTQTQDFTTIEIGGRETMGLLYKREGQNDEARLALSGI